MSRQMRLHQSNQSKLLRRDALGECRFCGNPVEWFDQYDARRIPLTPELPAGRVPVRLRWHLSRGVAYPGSDPFSDYCRLPHPAVCPAADREKLPPQLEEVRRLLAVRTRDRVERGLFTPYVEEPPEDPVRAPAAEVPAGPPGTVRHALNYHGDLRLARSAIDEVRCVAADETGERCVNPVFVLDEGHWERVRIPPAPGRSGQSILSDGGQMYVWSVTEYAWLVRWWRQHCPGHHNCPGTADAVPAEWETFQTFRHAEFIVTREPEGYAKLPVEGELTVFEGPRSRTVCAGADCLNVTVAAAPTGWLCWRCEKADRRRRQTQRRHLGT